MLKIIYEDEDILVIDKPPGLVVDKSETQKENTLEDLLASQGVSLERSGIVHRLDKDTSGVMVIAKTANALEDLQAQFASRRTKKEYLALVHGLVERSGVVEGAIARNPGDRKKFAVMENGKEASTEYIPVGNFQFSVFSFQKIFNDFNKIQMRKLEKMGYNQFSLLRCFPKTGRTHQIRVHLKVVGHPIVSDDKYGGRKMVRLDKRFCPRQFLHAAKLGFFHPKTGRWLEFETPLWPDLKNTLTYLEKQTT